MKISIGLTPKFGMKGDTVLCLMRMHTQIIEKYGSCTILTASAAVDEARNMIVDDFLKTDCTRLLFIDWDMTFPPTAAEMLIEADKDIIGCNAAKHVSGDPVITHNIDGVPLNYIKHDMEKVHAIGMAVTMIKREVFETMHWPWFHRDIVKDRRVLATEDYTFCKKAQQFHDYETWVHNDLSAQIGHIGEETKHMLPHVQRQVEAARKEQYKKELQKLKDELTEE
jgi:choline kinase